MMLVYFLLKRNHPIYFVLSHKYKTAHSAISRLTFSFLSRADLPLPQLPRLTLQSSTAKSFNFPEDLKGRWTLLYFYPADGSPGCTTQATQYRENYKSFVKHGVQVIGVNGGDLKSHSKFALDLHLDFPLLVDTDSKLAKAMGAYNGGMISRDSFLIGPDGKVQKMWRQVNANTTVAETYEDTLQILKGH